ncbi:MAG: AMP-binding protein, partial [Actinomycetota bacterium]|nr:AMP-binding protein [Actinomycetota bacterium]
MKPSDLGTLFDDLVLKGGKTLVELSRPLDIAPAHGTRYDIGQLAALVRGAAGWLHATGVRPGDRVAIVKANHWDYVLLACAAVRVGAIPALLSDHLSPHTLQLLLKRLDPALLVTTRVVLSRARDAETDLIGFARRTLTLDGSYPDAIDVENVRGTVPPPPVHRGVDDSLVVNHTSGTTGTPKGANRSSPQSLDPAVSLLSKIPLHYRQTTHIAAPLFHSWGFAHLTMSMLLQSTIVLTRKFDPEDCLAQIERTRAESLVVVPVMMSRILELDEDVKRKYDTSALKVVAASGSALPGDLAEKWMDEFGDNVYNLYGSTEVAWATIATPQDIRAAPGTAGKAPRGTV